MDSQDSRNFLSELDEIDWDFESAVVTRGLADHHWYPGRFIPQLPGVLIGNLTRPGDVILDPFCGVGTTLLEARRLGRSAVGIDTNPVAVLAARAKLLPIDRPRFEEYQLLLRAYTERLLAEDNLRGGPFEESALLLAVPNREENSRWYHPDTLRQLAAIWITITSEESPYCLAATEAFSSILRSASSQDKHWGWICDNVAPRELRAKDVVETFWSKLREFGVGVTQLEEETRRRFPHAHTSQEVLCGRCDASLRKVESRIFDAVITSPPYQGVTDYARSQRLSFLWLDLNLDAVRAEETGARYRRFRKAALTEYLADMRSSFAEISRVLKPGGICAVVFGQSPRREDHLSQFQAILASCGLEVQARAGRRPTVRRSLRPQVLAEEILILRKTGS